MILKVNDRIYLQTRNVIAVEDDPDKDIVKVWYNTATQMSVATGSYAGQDRTDVLAAMERAELLGD